MFKFEFMINLKTPQFLGLAVPQAVCLRRRNHRIPRYLLRGELTRMARSGSRQSISPEPVAHI
jgi:hypothetical protein